MRRIAVFSAVCALAAAVTGAVAYRWKSDFEENAKVFALAGASSARAVKSSRRSMRAVLTIMASCRLIWYR